MSAVSKLKAKLGVDHDVTADVIPLSAAGKIEVPADVLNEAKGTGGQDAEQDAQKKLAQALAPLKCAEDQYGEFVIETRFGQRMEVQTIESTGGEDAIRQALRSPTGKLPPASAMDNIKSQLRIDARNNNRKIIVHHRVARVGNAHVIDLGDPTGQIVWVEAGAWKVTTNTDIAFLRGRGYGALPIPVRPASASDALNILHKWTHELGIPRRMRLLVIVALVTWLRTGNAYPLLLFYGAAGCGKSWAARVILLLIDPPDSLALPNIKADLEHISAAAQQRHILSFDNVSKLSGAFQDTLCTCSTGGEIMARRLYTNGESVVLPIHRPVLMTAVQPVVTRPDLLSRTISVEFAQRTTRTEEDTLLSDFMNERPVLLGALCELLTAGN